MCWAFICPMSVWLQYLSVNSPSPKKGSASKSDTALGAVACYFTLYKFFLRLMSPAMPVPKRRMEAGKGTGAVDVLAVVIRK